MNSILARALAHLARRPLTAFNGRLPLLERLLDCTLNEHQAASVADSCRRASRRFGAFYHWKLEQIALIATLRAMGRDDMLAMVLRKDRTDYARVDESLADPRGLLIALPHHGHFVLSIVSLCERLRHRRNVFVFYDPPGVHATNEIFDVAHARLFGRDNIHVTILHNNRAGIVRAMKELRAGQIVIIMPDVYKNAHDTYLMPFCGAQRSAMLGTATIAGRTGARILPLVSQPRLDQFGFASAVGSLVEPQASDGTPEGNTHADFRTTTALFRQFEPFMHDQLLFWQYARNHVNTQSIGPPLTTDAIRTAGPMLLQDPRVNVVLHSPMILDQTQ